VFETYVGGTNGVFRLSEGRLEALGLEGERIWAIHARGGTVLAGSYGNGMYRSGDGGRTWAPANDGLTASAFRWIGPDPLDGSALLAGAEPARLYRSRDEGRTWRELDGITRIEGHEKWFLPYSPRAGAVRNVYAPPGSRGLLFASVEVGGLLRSDDGGETWSCQPVLEDEDIHYIGGHPSEPHVLYASLGYASLSRSYRADEGHEFGGIARSLDGGRSWAKLEHDYTRCTIVPPSRPDLVLAGPAPKVGRDGRIVASEDRGENWQAASGGVEVPMADMVERFEIAPDGSVWALCSGGRLLRAAVGEWAWRSALPDGGEVSAQSVAFAGG
jgi:photosystem II stability/assembly factor-like uncharacterized protein